MNGVWEFDTSTWSWGAEVGEPGLAGVASSWITESVRVDVDAYSGGLVGAVVDAESEDGALSVADLDALRSVGLAAPATGRAVEIDGEAFTTVSRLARVEESARAAEAMGSPTEAWLAEAAELRHRLGLPPASDLDVVGAPPPVGPVDAAVSRLAAAPLDLGALPPAGGSVALDPSALVDGILDVSEGARASWEGLTLRIEVPVRRGVYAPEVSRMTCAVRDGDELIALAPLSVSAGASGAPAAVAELTVSDRRDRSNLSLVVTADPRRLPSAELSALRASVMLGRQAATAARLGAAELAGELSARANVRRVQAGRPAARPAIVPDEPPFLGELVVARD